MTCDYEQKRSSIRFLCRLLVTFWKRCNSAIARYHTDIHAQDYTVFKHHIFFFIFRVFWTFIVKVQVYWTLAINHNSRNLLLVTCSYIIFTAVSNRTGTVPTSIAFVCSIIGGISLSSLCVVLSIVIRKHQANNIKVSSDRISLQEISNIKALLFI